MHVYQLADCLGAGTPEALRDVIQVGQYVYMEDLKTMVSRKPKEAWLLPLQLQPIHTPLRLSNRQRHLSGHPDLEFVACWMESPMVSE